MKRSAALKRSVPIARRTRVKARRSTPRRVSVLRDQEYMDWLKERQCVACKTSFDVFSVKYQPITAFGCLIDPAHTVNNGRSSKGPDSSCIPLCRRHHDEMDGRLNTAIVTKSQFAAKYGLDLAAEAAAHYALFLIDKENNKEC